MNKPVKFDPFDVGPRRIASIESRLDSLESKFSEGWTNSFQVAEIGKLTSQISELQSRVSELEKQVAPQEQVITGSVKIEASSIADILKSQEPDTTSKDLNSLLEYLWRNFPEVARAASHAPGIRKPIREALNSIVLVDYQEEI